MSEQVGGRSGASTGPLRCPREVLPEEPMIEASLSAVPALLPVFGVVALLFCSVAVWLARRKGAPVVPAGLLGVCLAGELAVTLTPTTGGASSRPSCSVGPEVWGEALSEQGVLNVGLYVPVAWLGVLVFRRPVTVLAGCGVLSAVTELSQTLLGTGRACDAADFVDNSAGAVLGVLLGVAWVLVRRGGFPRPVRDVRNGVVLGVVGSVAVGLALYVAVPVYRNPAGFVRSETEDIVTVTEEAKRLFGAEVKVLTTSSGGAVLSVGTDRGTFELEQPGGKLITFVAADHGVDGGSLTEEQVRSVGRAFAEAWFADQIVGAEQTVAPVGSNGDARVISYRRRNADGVLMPMRLDITVSTSGRIMAATARRVADPELPHVTVTVEVAKKAGTAARPGTRADTAFLLAKEVGGKWRPCWAVNLVREGEAKAAGLVAFVDAVSGQVVAQQG
ncbi:VanZ family protein [Kitasatospora sp. NPDC001309]|uniref:VanZ family protein n=1 Tax=Kitasatospora sp. NPDC001309 TaxID=3364013 RepID=UPI0036AD232B